MTAIGWILFTIAVLLIRQWWSYWLKRKMLTNMPGIRPSIVPWINPVKNHFLLSKFKTDGRHLTSAYSKCREELFNKYSNEGIYQFWCASYGEPLISVFTAELVHDVLRSSNFGTKSASYDLLHDWLGKGLLSSDGQQWKAQRRLLTPAFHWSVLEKYETVINRHSLELIHSMKQSHRSCLKNVELSGWAADCTIAILLETIMGLHPADTAYADCRDYVNAVNEATHLYARRFIKPWSRCNFFYFNSSEGKRYLKTVARLHRFTEEVISRKMRQFTDDPSHLKVRPGDKQSFIDILIGMHLQSEQITIKEMKDQVATFMFAGHDTTGWAIAWSLYQLGVYCDIQARVHTELDSVFGGDRARATTSDDLIRLPYFDQVLKECQRLNGSVPNISRRCSVDGSTIGKFKIPAGATISISLRYLHRDPKVFPDPEKFDPERFSPENCKGRHPNAYIPFSAGSRNCIGQKFALKELKILLVNILRNFQIVSSKPLHQLETAGEVIFKAKNGLHVEFVPR